MAHWITRPTELIFKYKARYSMETCPFLNRHVLSGGVDGGQRGGGKERPGRTGGRGNCSQDVK